LKIYTLMQFSSKLSMWQLQTRHTTIFLGIQETILRTHLFTGCFRNTWSHWRFTGKLLHVHMGVIQSNAQGLIKNNSVSW